MANLGSGAEAHARSKQYDYRANSSLVLAPDSQSRDIQEPTGEPERLHGKIHFGDRVNKGKPPKLDEKLNKSKKKKERDEINRQSKRCGLQGDNVLSSTEDGLYQPKLKETQAAYEIMLGVIQQQLSGQPLNVVTGAADEILAVIKNDRLKNSEKKKCIDKLLNPISNQIFYQLIYVGRLITDFQDAGGDGPIDALDDDDVGVAVVFEDNEEDDENTEIDIIQEDDDLEEEDDVLDEDGNNSMRMGGIMDDEDFQEGNEGMLLNVQEIDAYWLQRKISQAYEQQIDPHQIQKLAEEVLKVLEVGDDLEVESKLLGHLQFDKFGLIKYLLSNRMKIVWCTRLARAEDQHQRKQIEEQMKELGPDLVTMLEQLHATRSNAEDRQKKREKSVREEARPLKDETSGGSSDRDKMEIGVHDVESGWLNGQQRLLDLESISINQGSLLMANKKCELPLGSYRSHNKGYEEVHVPKLKPKPLAADEKLVKISAMPNWAQMAFEGMGQLNRVQSKVYETALFKADNILLCAPTGAGKTNVAMLTILQHIGLHMNEDGSFNHNDYKIVYVAPMKALVAEVVGNLSNRLKHYGVTVMELSGDLSLTRK